MREQQAHYYQGYRYQPRPPQQQPSKPTAYRVFDLDDIDEEPGRRTVFMQPIPGTAASSPAMVRVTHHRKTIPPRATAARQTGEDERLVLPASSKRTRRRPSWLTIVGMTFLVMIAGYVSLNAALNWWQNWTDDMRYGRPRTYQTDARVGHGDELTPSHFIAVNLNGRILVTEIAGADPAKSTIYTGPDIGDADIPVTLEFQDVNGDKRPDMLIVVNEKRFVFINDTIKDKPQFRQVKPGEAVSL